MDNTFDEWWAEFSKTSPYGKGYRDSIARKAFEAGYEAGIKQLQREYDLKNEAAAEILRAHDKGK